MIAQANGVATVAESDEGPRLPGPRSFTEHDVLAIVIRDLTAGAMKVYLAIQAHANAERRAWPSQERIAALTRLSVRSVRYATEELRSAGLLESKRMGVNGRTLLVYTLRQPEAHCRMQHGDNRQSVAGRDTRNRQSSVEQPAIGCSASGNALPPNHHHEPDREPIMMNGSAIDRHDDEGTRLETRADSLHALTGIGVDRSEAVKWSEQLPPEEIAGAIDRLRERERSARPVKNRPAYLVDLLQKQAKSRAKRTHERRRSGESALSKRATEIREEIDGGMTTDQLLALIEPLPALADIKREPAVWLSMPRATAERIAKAEAYAPAGV